MLSAWQIEALAALQLAQPDSSTSATFVGNGGYSADALGQFDVGETVQAEVPAGSTVEQAYLYGAYSVSSPSQASRNIDFDGTVYELTPLDSVEFLSSARADVTSQVAARIGAGGGITDFVINSDPRGLEGVGLVVVYSNPGLPETTVAVLDGAQATSGDTVTFNFAEPLDKTVPGFSAQMSLGIGYGFQGADGDACGSVGQFSLVDVNGQRLTSCAGGYDDGDAGNGALITVGGVGDDTSNPSNPLASAGTPEASEITDDELYDISGLLNQGDNQLAIRTENPSNDDIVFLAVIAVTAEATVTTEVCDDAVDNDGDDLVDGDDPDCQDDDGGEPEPGPTCPGYESDPRPQIVGTPGDDTLTGTGDAEIICGLEGRDTISGGGGDDLILGGPGRDKIYGDGGNDTVDAGPGLDVVEGNDGDDTVDGGRDNDLVRGMKGDDTVIGGHGYDQLTGDEGNDRMYGGPHRDTLLGGPGKDLLNGGPARDQCSGDADDLPTVSCP